MIATSAVVFVRSSNPQFGKLIPPTATPQPDIVELHIAIGSEKNNYLNNPKVVEILETQYQVKLAISKKGTYEQSLFDDQELSQFDVLWPSSDTVDIIEALHNSGMDGFSPVSLTSERIFQSALVAYTRQDMADAFIKAGIVAPCGDTLCFTDTQKLIQLMLDGESYQSVCYSAAATYLFYFDTTDPRKSNSGHLEWTCVYPSFLAQQFPLTDVNLLKDIAPSLVDTFQRLPAMEHSTGTLFETYTSNPLKKGIFIAYEFQWVERQDAVNSDLVRIYMDPTVMSYHPLILINRDTDSAEVSAAKQRLLDALYNDVELHTIALKEHGFLSANPTMQSQIGNYKDIAAQVGLNMSVNPMPLPKAQILLTMTALYMKPELVEQFAEDPSSVQIEDVLTVFSEFNTNLGW